MKSVVLIVCFIFSLMLIPMTSIAADAMGEGEGVAYQDKVNELTEDFSFPSVVEEYGESVMDVCFDYEMELTIQKELIRNNLYYVAITSGLYAFSLLVIIYLMKITPHKARDLVTTIGLVSVVFGAILVVLVVDTSESLTAPIGILGAIAGYLFGAAQKKEKSGQ